MNHLSKKQLQEKILELEKERASLISLYLASDNLIKDSKVYDSMVNNEFQIVNNQNIRKINGEKRRLFSFYIDGTFLTCYHTMDGFIYVAKGFDINFVLKSISKKVSLGGNISQAKTFLEKYKDELDVETIKMLEDFTTLQQKSWWQKRAILWKYRLLKQGFIRNAGLFLKI